MHRRSYLYAVAVLALGCVGTIHAAPPKSLELFGVNLRDATRTQFRQTLKQNGLQASREDDSYWVDVYDAKGVLEGASEFQVGYVAETQKFAYARYTFKAFMDEQLVGKVISMVSSKYGKPSTQTGDFRLGPVTAWWNLGQGMQIEVTRGWPDTTTFLSYYDQMANMQMSNEIEAEKRSQEQAKNKTQSKAF